MYELFCHAKWLLYHMYDSFPRGSQVRIGLSMRRGRTHLYPWGNREGWTEIDWSER